MPVFRVVWEFSDAGGATFNEVYYVTAMDAKTAATTTGGLSTARCALLHPLVRLVVIRSSQVDANRVTSNVAYNMVGTAVVSPDQDAGPSTPGNAIICTLSATPTGSRKLWMRGAPDYYIQRGAASGQDFLASNVKDKLTTFFSKLQANAYGIRVLTPQTGGALSNIKILSVDGTVPGGIASVTLAAAPGYAFPSRVIIGGASKKDLPGLNGRWSLAEAPALNVVKIPYQTPQNRLVTGGNGKMRQEVYTGINVFVAENCGFSHFGTRTTKNPSSHSRGARRAVRLRTSL